MEKAAQIGHSLADIPGIADLKVQPLIMIPQVKVHFQPEKAAQFGLTPADVRQATTTLIQGTKVGEIYEEQKIYDVVVWGTPEARSNIEALGALLIDTPLGGAVPLRDVAQVLIAPTPNVISREAASRKIDVTCNVAGRDLGSVVQDIKTKLTSISFAAGYYPEVLGEYAEREHAAQRL
jgi:Cu/Ag efflux pump CusA